MVKHVYYKKQATGCTWHLLSKMERKAFLVKRREQDRKRKEQARQERLMVGYINVKYPLIYKEAKGFYNKVNNLYPDKHDLLKTARFKELQHGTIKDNMLLRIPLTNLQTNKPEETLSRKAIDQRPPAEKTLNLEVIDQRPPPQETLNLEVIDQRPPPQETLNLEVIDQRPPPQETLNLEVIDQRPPPQETLNLEVIDQLPPDLEAIAATTLVSELSPDLIQSIIDNLRADPELKMMMDEIEDQVMNEDEDVDIDINIPDNLLENELLHW